MVPQREKQKRDKTSLKDWTEQMKASLFFSLSLCCGSFSISFLESEELATEVMFAMDQDATGSMH